MLNDAPVEDDPVERQETRDLSDAHSSTNGLGLLPGDWPKMLCDGEVLMALILSTSFSEKYKGRHMQPGATAEITLPAPGDQTWTCHPHLLHRAGNKEAVAYIWLSNDQRSEPTLYVAFSPLRHRSQFFKIWCSGDIQDGLDLNNEPRTATLTAGTQDGKSVNVPVSAYVYHKLRKLWGLHGLWDGLKSMYDKYEPNRIIFSGISHGAALAQVAALQFQMTIRQAKVYVVTWNAYRWTSPIGRAVVDQELGDRILPFALSRVRAEPQATRYWDSVTGFPSRYASMPNMLLLDADTGAILEHKDPDTPAPLTGAFLMRMFELHFARAALAATKKATKQWCGCVVKDEDRIPEEEQFVMSPMAERIQERILSSSQKLAEAQMEVKRRSSEAQMELKKRSARLRSMSRELSGVRLPRSLSRLPRGPDQTPPLPLWKRLVCCCS